ncbi:transglycosylase domain-containing protein [Amycolatopsis sp., V23-08]|uniref:Transglycosylase domain-containing protein n=1 Tax=Amycolatopsis heterodermiae TaxID=3110235 RepID=A0ABU5R272_9PSEU|nr:transglycosylase domain-containing protein [Amycolatopsis sp., V23-08]MEA5359764.1 transglycosylase domain-containing protein [Amycolatopsis sp., V23-08]
MNDDRNRSWPGQEPDAPRRAQSGPWPGEDPGPAWPGEEAPRRPQRGTPPRGVPSGRGGAPEWPSGDEGGPQWPADEPARRPQRARQQGMAARRPVPPPPGQRPQQGPPGSPPQGFRQPPPGRRPVPPPGREPDLITHHAHNGTDDFGRDPYDDGYDDDAAFNEYADDVEPQEELDEKGKKVLTPAQKKKRRWKIIRRCAYVFVGLFFVVPAIAFVITYFLVDVPTPESIKALQSQPITYYDAGGQLMGRELPPGGDRQLLKPGEVPEVVKHAVYSAEDATFETNSGFDVTGILRAVFNQVTGGQGGGSTISQQYIKQATQNDQQTLTRKWTELAKSFKMNNQQSKEEIITSYLNIVYFGRGANGIQAAAKAYFNKDAKDLNASEASLLAGLIQGPGRSENEAYAQKRWTYVMDQMVANKWLPQADRAAAQYPTPIPKNSNKEQDSGKMTYQLQQRIKDELAVKGYDENKLFSTGAKIYTTIDPAAQAAAEQASQEGMKGQTDENLLNALVAVNPKTGGVIAYYGGPELVKDANGKDQIGQDRANQARNPGSSVKAFDLTAFLKMGKGLGETFDGSNNRVLGGRTVRNAGDSASCGKDCTVAKAMEISANTVFYDMVLNVTKPSRVAEAAKEAGVKVSPDGKSVLYTDDNNISLGGGGTAVTPEDMAAAYASFANGGTYHEQHFVSKLTNGQDEVEFDENNIKTNPAFDDDASKSQQIAGNVTEALVPVIDHSKLKCPTGHECAGKTGTQQYTAKADDPKAYADRNAQTWMVGYTPSVSAAVWVGGDGNKPLHDPKNKPIFGATIAGPTWQSFMNLYLKGKPAEKFDKVAPIGKDASTVTSTPPKPSETPTTTTTPTTPETTTSTEPTDTETNTSTKPSRPTLTRPGPGGPGDPGIGNTFGGGGAVASPPGAGPG